MNMFKLYKPTFCKNLFSVEIFHNSVLRNGTLKRPKGNGLEIKYFRTSAVAAQTPVSEGVCPAHSDNKQVNHDAEWNAHYHVDRATWESAKPFSEMPGLRKNFFLIGNIRHFMPSGKYHKLPLAVFLKKFHDDFGLIGKTEGVIGSDDTVFLASPEDIEKVYKQEGMFPKKEFMGSMTHFRKNFRQEVFKDAIGLATSNGQEWYVFRNKVNGIMMQPKVVKQYITQVDSVAVDFVNKIRRIRKPDGTVGDIIMKETNKWALESMGLLALDQRLGSLEDNLSIDSLPHKMIVNSEDLFLTSAKLDFQPSLWRYIWTPNYAKAMKLYDEQLTFAQINIEKAMNEIKEKRRLGTQDVEDKEKSVLEKLWDVDPKVAVVMVSDMLLGGIDSTAVTLINVLYYLSSNPDKQDILRKEIVSLLPNKDSEVNVEHLSQMPYLKACIKEAARIYPSAPGSSRILTKNSVLYGYRVPKGMKVLMSHAYASLMESQFPRPLEYIPERWLRDNDTELSYKNASQFSSMNFGFGSRSCIGRRFAELEVDVAVISLVRNFNMTWKGDPPTQASINISFYKPPFGFVFNDALN